MEIETALIIQNKWWKEKFSASYLHRDIYDEIKKFINTPQIIAFSGLRRVGKTTLMFKIVEDYIYSGLNKDNIIYFSFDEFKEVEIKEVLDVYERILKKDLSKGKYVLLLDEVQKLNDWENKVKMIYDIYKNIKIFVSGSESLFIRKKSKESLAGRIFEFQIKPLTFKEFLLFRNFKQKNPNLYKKELLNLFEEFIYSGGFPELVNLKDKSVIRKYLRETVIEKIIYKDIPSIFSIDDVSILESIINILIDYPGQLIEIKKFSEELKISRQTLSLYLKYLEDSFLIKKLYNFSKNKRKTERKLKKYYPSVPSLSLIDNNFPRIFECLIVLELNAEYFWRDPYKNEVDIVIVRKNKILPVEVKYGKKFEIGGLVKFMDKFNIKKGHIISFDQEKTINHKGKVIEVVPAYKFLLKLKNE